MSGRSLLGASAIALAVGFNAPYAALAARFDYPDILRRPAGEVLERFAEGGPALVLTWWGFALSALALSPLAIGLAVSPERLQRRPALALGAAVTGALAGVSQAIGLLRWVFVTPGLAETHQAPGASESARAMAEQAYELLNAYGGVAIGEHLGQLLTALFAGQLAALQALERKRVCAGLGLATAITIASGTGEGLALALGANGAPFGLLTICGFLALTAWLLATGVSLIAPDRAGAARAPNPQTQTA